MGIRQVICLSRNKTHFTNYKAMSVCVCNLPSRSTSAADTGVSSVGERDIAGKHQH